MSKCIDNPIKEIVEVEGWSACSLHAIGYMFNTDAEGMKLIAKLAKWKHPSQGPTGTECGRAIRLLATLHKKRVIYTRNKGIKNKKQLLARLGRWGQFILNYEEHLGVYKNGVFVDDWSPFSWDLEGWWQIIDKYPKPRKNNHIILTPHDEYLSMSA